MSNKSINSIFDHPDFTDLTIDEQEFLHQCLQAYRGLKLGTNGHTTITIEGTTKEVKVDTIVADTSQRFRK